MNTWICRILTFVFFVNCFPVQTWAESARAAKRRRAVEDQVARQVQNDTFSQWQQEVKELEGVLQQDDLTADERQFAQLQLDSAKLHIQHIEAFDNEHYTDLDDINRFYESQLKVLSVQEEDLEKKILLRSFYQTAQSDQMIAAAVYALHKHAADSADRYQEAKLQSDQDTSTFNRKYHQDQELARQRAFLEQASRDYLTQQPSSLRVAQAQAQPLDRAATSNQSWILKAWADGTISPEELVEYADPVGNPDATTQDIAAAAELLFYTFYGFNAPDGPTDSALLADAIWMAKRLQYRAQHQLYVLEQKAKENNSLSYVQARGNLMRLSLQVKNLLAKHQKPADQATLQALDQQLPEFAPLKKELTAYRQGAWSYSSVAKAIFNDVLQALKENPKADSREATFLLQDLAYATSYFITTGNTGYVADFIVQINEDDETFHGDNERYVSTIFGSIFEAMTSYNTSVRNQQTVKELLVCAGAPVCQYGDTKQTNAVNVRVQALAVGSMLRQVAKTNQIPAETPIDKPEEVAVTLDKGVFDDPSFRQKMANYTVDIYGPTHSWTKKNIKRYGLELDELRDLQDHLARIFESYLPVKEPKSTTVVVKEGVYKNCWIREVDTRHLVPLNNLQISADFVEPGESEKGYKCNELAKNKMYGGMDNIVVMNSSGHLIGMTRFNPFNRKQKFQDIATNLIGEVATWYLWGAAFKGLNYLWKGIRATAVATRAATKASAGFKVARFNSKFSQVWKLSTRGWQTEMGLVNVTKNGDKIFVEMARPGFQGRMMEFGKEVLGGHSLKSLKGRILLRRAIQRDIIEGGASQTFGKTLTKAERRIVAGEKPYVEAAKQDLQSLPRDMQEAIAQGKPAIYRPQHPQDLLFDLEKGTQETVSIHPITGNITGDISGLYQGTIIAPYVQNPVAYNIAQGLSTVPSLRVTSSVLYSKLPILQEMNGLTKFVLTMTALDKPIYYGYVKPYMEAMAKRQEAQLSQATGYKPSKEEAQTPKTLLELVQSLSTKTENTTGATLQGVFFGANQLLNYVLPNPVQSFRQWLFKQTTDIAGAIDAPFAKALGAEGAKFLPLPGSVLTLYPMLASDPTSDKPTEADRAQYEVSAQQQALEASMEQHTVSIFQQQMDQATEDLEKGLPMFLQQNEPFLAALPQARKEIKRAYKTYEQAIKAARKLAKKDLDQAGKDFDDASRKFTYTQADVMQRVIQAYVAQEKSHLPQIMASYRTSYTALFSPQRQEQYEQLYNQYYKQYQTYLTAFFAAPKTALEGSSSAAALQDEAQNNLQQLDKTFMDKLNQLNQELNDLVEPALTILQEAQEDYKHMYPYLISLFPQEAQTEINNLFDEFDDGIKRALENAPDAATLQDTCEQLKAIRNQRFEQTKEYWIDINPAYQLLFERTIGVVEEKQKQADAARPFHTPNPFSLNASGWMPKDMR